MRNETIQFLSRFDELTPEETEAIATRMTVQEEQSCLQTKTRDTNLFIPLTLGKKR